MNLGSAGQCATTPEDVPGASRVVGNALCGVPRTPGVCRTPDPRNASDGAAYRASRARLALAGLLAVALLVVGGCGGCGDEKTDATDKTATKTKTQAKKEKPKPDFESPALYTLPSEGAASSLVKPGHWCAVRQETVANNANFIGRLDETVETRVVDTNGRPMGKMPAVIDGTGYELRTTRPAQLAKGKLKGLDAIVFAPVGEPNVVPDSQQPRNVYLNSSLRFSGGGTAIEWPGSPLRRMKPHEFFLVVLAPRAPAVGYGHWKTLGSIKPGGSLDERAFDRSREPDKYYDVVIASPESGREIPLSEQPLTWTSIAYLVWDDCDPNLLTAGQQQALVDWLHFGGQVIISGPKSLDRLKGSFLEPYLPAAAAKTVNWPLADVRRELELGPIVMPKRDDEQARPGNSVRARIWQPPDPTDPNNVVQNVPPRRSDAEEATEKQLNSTEPLLGVELELHDDARPLGWNEAAPEAAGPVLVAERQIGRGRTVVTAFPLADPRLLHSQGYDQLLNGLLLRRPARVVKEEPISNTRQVIRWADGEEHRLDPARLSRFRLFTREGSGNLISNSDFRSLTEDGRPVGWDVNTDQATAVNFSGDQSNGFTLSAASGKVVLRQKIPDAMLPNGELLELTLDCDIPSSSQITVKARLFGPTLDAYIHNETLRQHDSYTEHVVVDHEHSRRSQAVQWIAYPEVPLGHSAPPQTDAVVELEFANRSQPTTIRLNEVSLRRSGTGSAWDDQSAPSNAARDSLREAAGIEVPGASFVLWMVAAYLVVLVPLNWAVFRALGRVELAWAAAPLISLVFAFLVVRIAQLDIGFARSQTEINVLEIQGGYSRAHLTRYTALYTSLSTGYDLEQDNPSAVALPFATGVERMHGQRTSTATLATSGDDRVTLEDYQVASNSTGMLHAEAIHDLGGTIALKPSGVGGDYLANGTRLDLRGAAILRRTPRGQLQAAWLGDVPAGESIHVTFDAGSGADQLWEHWNETPETSNETGLGKLNISRLVRLAVDDPLAPGDTRLVAWTNEDIPGMTLDPAASQVRRATLIVTHLHYGPLSEPEKDELK